MALNSAISVSPSGLLRAGIVKFGVRWNTVNWAASSAITGIAWIAEDPVPITATRLPLKSTGSFGHLEVWYHSPPKDSRPGKGGGFGTVSRPAASSTHRAEIVSPWFVSTSQRLRSSS